jgi:Calx-beta domain
MADGAADVAGRAAGRLTQVPRRPYVGHMRGTCAGFVLIAMAVLLLGGTASAAPVLRVAAGANAAAIQTAVDQFRTDLGGVNNGVGEAFPTGRREINWDGVPDASAEPNALPFDFFNVTSARGVVFQSVGNIGGQHQFRVSADSSNPTVTPVRFGNIDPSYSVPFQTFTAERLFAPRFANTIDVYFFLPGTKIPATVSGFGAVFADVDTSNTYIEYYAADGRKLSGNSANVANNGLTFLGTSFTAGERVARVQMTLGTEPLKPGSVDGTAGVDVVALDDFIYGEPQADPGAFRFADAKVVGAEGGAATVSVVRSGRGPASVGLTLSGGTATASSDYTPFSGVLTFGLDETVKTVTIPLAQDNATEGDETANLALSSPAGGSVTAPSSATLTIVDRPPAAPASSPITPALTPPALTPPSVTTQDRTPPAVVLGRAPTRMTRAAFLRGLAVVIAPNEPSSLVVELLGTTDRAALARARDVTIASRTLPLAAGKRTVRLRPTRKLVLHAHRRFTARLRVTATDAAGNRTIVTRRIAVRQR